MKLTPKRPLREQNQRGTPNRLKALFSSKSNKRESLGGHDEVGPRVYTVMGLIYLLLAAIGLRLHGVYAWLPSPRIMEYRPFRYFRQIDKI